MCCLCRRKGGNKKAKGSNQDEDDADAQTASSDNKWTTQLKVLLLTVVGQYKDGEGRGCDMNIQWKTVQTYKQSDDEGQEQQPFSAWEAGALKSMFNRLKAAGNAIYSHNTKSTGKQLLI